MFLAASRLQKDFLPFGQPVADFDAALVFPADPNRNLGWTGRPRPENVPAIRTRPHRRQRQPQGGFLDPGLDVSQHRHLRPQQGSLLGNHFVWITSLSLAAATLFHRQLDRTSGGQELGSLALYVYLFTIGLPADLLVVLGSVPEMFVYCGIMAVVNLAVTLALGRLFRLDLEDLLLSVNAALGGPPSAMAMAIAKRWQGLVLPAMLVGIWGYVVGTPLGIATTHLLRALFGSG